MCGKINVGVNMKYEINNICYNVEIEKKFNKNTYIRVKDDCTIFVTTSYFVTQKEVYNLLDKNKSLIMKMIDKKSKELEKAECFYYLGQKYDIITVTNIKKMFIQNDKVFVNTKENLDKWINKECKRIFKERLDIIYNIFEENIPYPKLKIRDMKTRWGVCSRRDTSITLNSRLIKEELAKIDYVIIHELSHFVHFNHSKDFWLEVAKYCPNYKRIRKDLKE